MDDFERDVHCLAGLPFDAVTLEQAADRVRAAVKNQQRCFFSTPNLNFLMLAQRDPAFRESVLCSNLVIADGMPLVWVAKMLGIPIVERVAGSDLFEALRHDVSAAPMKVYFFGGPDGIAEQAAQRLNQQHGGLYCVGFSSPGFVSVEAMSTPEQIAAINASGADFLVVSLGARKGQEWIMRNREQLRVPIISHLGAVLNFEAQTVRRAPVWMQHAGMEWLWRIREEPALWRRYAHDGWEFVQWLSNCILPHMVWLRTHQPCQGASKGQLLLQQQEDGCRLVAIGAICDPVIPEIRAVLRESSTCQGDVTLDLAQTRYLSTGFLGLLLLLEQALSARGRQLRMIGTHGHLAKLLRWSGVLPA